MRVLVSGGGTAGHINPALAIADKIRKEWPDAVIEYVGTPKGMENKLAEQAGYKMHHVAVRGFARSLSPVNIDAAIKSVTSVIKAKRIIREFKPDVVIGTGGYVSWPVLKAASGAHIPTLIHEQNAVPGVTTKMLSKVVDKVMISFESSRQCFTCDASKLILVGNPVSEKMLSTDKASARRALGIPSDAVVLLSAGGSLGAARINDAVFELVRDTLPKYPSLLHFHATGRSGYEEQAEKYRSLGFADIGGDALQKGGVTVRQYIYNMPELLSAADIVICRAGAMTLSELAVKGKAAIIIPSPNVTNNHQYKNAKVLADAEAGILLTEDALSGETLSEAVGRLLADNAYRRRLENNVRAFGKTDTLDVIFGAIREVMEKYGRTV